MKMKGISFIAKIALVNLLFTGFFQGVSAYAMSASIFTSPPQGNYNTGDTFNVDLKLDGGGTQFNVAQANVQASSNLTVQNVIYGDCNFSFIVSPSVNNLNFLGAILGGKSSSCTVYTVTLKAISSGIGTLTLTKPKLKSYPDSKDIYMIVAPGQYTINASSNGSNASALNVIVKPNLPLQSSPPINGKYNLFVTVVSEDNKPISGISVVLLTSTPVKNQSVSVLTDTNGIAQFKQVQSGAQEIKIVKDSNKIADKIMTVSGNNQNIHISLKAQSNNSSSIWSIFSLIFIIVAGLLLLFIYVKRKPHYPKLQTQI